MQAVHTDARSRFRDVFLQSPGFRKIGISNSFAARVLDGLELPGFVAW